MNEQILYFDTPMLVSSAMPGSTRALYLVGGWLLQTGLVVGFLVAGLRFLDRHSPRLQRGPVSARYLAGRVLGSRGFLVVFAFALLARLIGYNTDSISSQEATYLSGTYWAPPNLLLLIWNPVALMNLQPLLFRLVISSLRFIAPYEALLRLPSVLAGALAAALVWRLARDLFGSGASFLCAVAFIVSPMDVFYSQRLLPYEWTIALALASLALMERYFHGPADRRIGYLWWTVPVNVLGLYSHMSYIAYVVAMLLHAAWTACQRRDRQPILMVAKASLLAGVWYLPHLIPVLFITRVYKPFLEGLFQRSGYFFVVDDLPRFFLDSLLCSVSHQWMALDGLVPEAAPGWVGAVLLFARYHVFVLLAFAAAYLLCVERRAFFTCVVPMLVLLGSYYVSNWLKLPYLALPPRHFHLVTPFTFLTLAGLLGVATRRHFRLGRWAATVSLSAAILTSAASTGWLSTQEKTPAFEQATRFVAPQMRDGDAFVFSPGFWFADQFLFYYFDRDVEPMFNAKLYSTWYDLRGSDGQFYVAVTNTTMPYEQSMSSRFIKRIWFIETFEEPLGIRFNRYDATDQILRALRARGWIERSAWPFHSIVAHLFERAATSCEDSASDRFELRIGSNDYYYLTNFEPRVTVPVVGGRRPIQGARILIPLPPTSLTRSEIQLNFDSQVLVLAGRDARERGAAEKAADVVPSVKLVHPARGRGGVGGKGDPPLPEVRHGVVCLGTGCRIDLEWTGPPPMHGDHLLLELAQFETMRLVAIDARLSPLPQVERLGEQENSPAARGSMEE